MPAKLFSRLFSCPYLLNGANIPIITCESGYMQPLDFAQCNVRSNLLRATEDVIRHLAEQFAAARVQTLGGPGDHGLIGQVRLQRRQY